MSDLKSAIERLERAVDGLEYRAGQQRLDAETRQVLAAELAESRAECARLAELTTGVAARLDGAIATVKTVLEG